MATLVVKAIHIQINGQGNVFINCLKNLIIISQIYTCMWLNVLDGGNKLPFFKHMNFPTFSTCTDQQDISLHIHNGNKWWENTSGEKSTPSGARAPYLWHNFVHVLYVHFRLPLWCYGMWWLSITGWSSSMRMRNTPPSKAAVIGFWQLVSYVKAYINYILNK